MPRSPARTQQHEGQIRHRPGRLGRECLLCICQDASAKVRASMLLAKDSQVPMVNLADAAGIVKGQIGRRIGILGDDVNAKGYRSG